MIHPEMIREILSNYSLDVMGIHGISHGARVLENGLKLAGNTGANPKIVALFETVVTIQSFLLSCFSSFTGSAPM
jgi:hypothetical protein